MQIHELTEFQGMPGSGDFLAIDNGNRTQKIEAENLGVTTAMTTAEAEAGTSTDKRVMTPKMFHDYVEDNTAKGPVLVINISSFSSLPKTVTHSSIKANMTVTESVLSNPSAQVGDWDIATSDGSLVITGSISGSTTLTLKMEQADVINV